MCLRSVSHTCPGRFGVLQGENRHPVGPVPECLSHVESVCDRPEDGTGPDEDILCVLEPQWCVGHVDLVCHLGALDGVYSGGYKKSVNPM